MTRGHRAVVLAFAAVALLRSLVLAWIITPYQSSDEPWHLDYARSLADGRLPVLGETRLDPAIVEHDRRVTDDGDLTLYGIDDPPMSREAAQPPLAYVLPAVAYRLGGDDPARGLVAFRVIDALLGTAAVVVAAWFGRAAFPSRPHAAVVAAAVTALLPSCALVASTANNDALALVLSLAALGVVVETVRRGSVTLVQCALVGGLVGVAALAKANALVLVVPALVVAWRRRAIGVAATLAATALVVGPWIARNMAVYGSPFGTDAFERFHPAPGRDIGGMALFLAGRPTAPTAERFWPELVRTAVGVLRWSDLRLPFVVYLAAVVATVAGAIAVARWLRIQASPGDRAVAFVIASTCVALVVAVMGFAYAVDYQPQGRYVLAGLVAAAAVVGAATGRRGAVAVAALGAVMTAMTIVVAVEAFGWP